MNLTASPLNWVNSLGSTCFERCLYGQICDFCIMFCRSLFVLFVFFLLVIVSYVLLRFTAFDCPIAILDLRLLIAPLLS